MKRMILGEQENVFLFEFGLIIPAVLNYLFRHNLKSYPYLVIFCSNQRFS